MTAYEVARSSIDAVHAADPARSADGRAAELLYADRIEEWVVRLMPFGTPLLRLAARCQHLERWLVPRATFPPGKAGYHAWRKSLYQRQADRARELLLAAGISPQEADEAALWISKSDLHSNPFTQVLEDAAVLVFLEHEIGDFAARHGDYSEAKFIGILRKTWRKLSPAGQTAAGGLELPPPIAALVQAALRD